MSICGRTFNCIYFPVPKIKSNKKKKRIDGYLTVQIELATPLIPSSKKSAMIRPSSNNSAQNQSGIAVSSSSFPSQQEQQQEGSEEVGKKSKVTIILKSDPLISLDVVSNFEKHLPITKQVLTGIIENSIRQNIENVLKTPPVIEFVV